MNTNAQFQTLSDQELRSYYQETRDEAAYLEILRRGPNDKDREALQQFQAWQKTQQ